MTTFCAKLPTHVCTILIYCFALYSNFCGHRPRQDFFTSNLSAAEKLPLRNRNEAIAVKQNAKTVLLPMSFYSYVYFLRYFQMVYVTCSIVCRPLKTAAVKEATSLTRRFSTVHVHTVGSLATVLYLLHFLVLLASRDVQKYKKYCILSVLAQLQLESHNCCNALYTDVTTSRLNSLIV